MLFSIELPDSMTVREIRVVLKSGDSFKLVQDSGKSRKLPSRSQVFLDNEGRTPPPIRTSSPPSPPVGVRKHLAKCRACRNWGESCICRGELKSLSPQEIRDLNRSLRESPGYEGTPLSKPKPLKAVKCPTCKEFKRECHCGIEGSE